jgi:Kdo2-lipid IVA lauroyltransferase/acyltransferase
MKKIKYFFEFVIITFFFIIFKTLGYKIGSNLGALIGYIFGPIFRSKNIIVKNIKRALPKINDNEISNITKNMWSNYGRILSDYMFIKNFRNSKLDKYLKIDGIEILEKIKLKNKPVVFVSGHFNNFELMAMQIEKSGINLAAIYRPLNNIFINRIMENIRNKYICKKQIKKGRSGLRDILTLIKKNYSIALMIDQRVSEGISVNFFNQPALTTTIPAQLVKKFNCEIVPIYIERINKVNYRIVIQKPFNFNTEASVENITLKLNLWLEKMILHNPSQWIWSHNRWK